MSAATNPTIWSKIQRFFKSVPVTAAGATKLGLTLLAFGGAPLKTVAAIEGILSTDITQLTADTCDTATSFDLTSFLEDFEKLYEKCNCDSLKEAIEYLEEYITKRAESKGENIEELEQLRDKIVEPLNKFANSGINSIAMVYGMGTAVLLLSLYISCEVLKSSKKSIKFLKNDIIRATQECDEMLSKLSKNNAEKGLFFGKNDLNRFQRILETVLSLEERVNHELEAAKRNKALFIGGMIAGGVLTGAGVCVLTNVGTTALAASIAIALCTVCNIFATIKFGFLAFKDSNELIKELENIKGDLNKLIENLKNNDLLKWNKKSKKYEISDLLNKLEKKNKNVWDKDGNIDNKKIDDFSKLMKQFNTNPEQMKLFLQFQQQQVMASAANNNV